MMSLRLGNGENFAQQGTVDWVQLGNTTVSATVAVFARLAAANIDPLTVSVAQALSGSFILSDEGSSYNARNLVREFTFTKYKIC